MENLINQIIAKVRHMYRFDKRYYDILNQNAEIQIMEAHGTLCLQSIVFNNWDKIVVTSDCIQLITDSPMSRRQTLMEYDSWETLLNL